MESGRWSFTCFHTTHFLLCGLVPKRLWTSGLGTPAVEYTLFPKVHWQECFIGFLSSGEQSGILVYWAHLCCPGHSRSKCWVQHFCTGSLKLKCWVQKLHTGNSYLKCQVHDLYKGHPMSRWNLTKTQRKKKLDFITQFLFLFPSNCNGFLLWHIVHWRNRCVNKIEYMLIATGEWYRNSQQRSFVLH